MNSAVLEVAQAIAEGNQLTIREVVARFRRVGVEFRTESNPSFMSDQKSEQILLGYAYQGFFYPYTDENKVFLDGLIRDCPKAEARYPVKPVEKPVEKSDGDAATDPPAKEAETKSLT